MEKEILNSIFLMENYCNLNTKIGNKLLRLRSYIKENQNTIINDLKSRQD